MTAGATRNGTLSNSGTLSPNPWDLSLSRQDGSSKLEDTRTEDRAPQGCAPSADSRAGMAAAAPIAGPSQTQPQTSSKQSLLKAQNGLDEGVHFTLPFAIQMQSTSE